MPPAPVGIPFVTYGARIRSEMTELIDALIARLTINGMIELVRRARDENSADPYMVEMLDTDGTCGPRQGKPCLLHEMKQRNFTRLLDYGKFYRTPVAELDLETGQYRGCYLDLRFHLRFFPFLLRGSFSSFYDF